jgi:hypothetical protein
MRPHSWGTPRREAAEQGSHLRRIPVGGAIEASPDAPILIDDERRRETSRLEGSRKVLLFVEIERQ